MSLQICATIDVATGSQPRTACKDPDHDYFYVGCGANNKYVIIDSATGAISATESEGIGIRGILVDTDANNKIWIGGAATDLFCHNKDGRTASVTFADIVTGRGADDIEPLCFVEDCVCVADTEVTSSHDPVFNLRLFFYTRSGSPALSYSILWPFRIGGACYDGSTFLYACSREGNIVKIHIPSKSLSSTFVYDADLLCIKYDTVQDKIYVGDMSNSVVVVLNTSGTILATIQPDGGHVGTDWSIGIDPASETGIVAGRGNATTYSEVYAFNLKGYGVGTTVTVTDGADRMFAVAMDTTNDTVVIPGYTDAVVYFMDDYGSGC